MRSSGQRQLRDKRVGSQGQGVSRCYVCQHGTACLKTHAIGGAEGIELDLRQGQAVDVDDVHTKRLEACDQCVESCSGSRHKRCKVCLAQVDMQQG